MELYKGKRIDNGKWVQGNLYSVSPKKAYIITCMDEKDVEPGYSSFWLDCLCVMVDPDTVCRFTGLYDNHDWKDLSYKEQLEFLESWNWKKGCRNTKYDWRGRMIWENDIVRFRHGGGFTKVYFRNYKIEYINTYCQYGLRFINGKIHFPCKQSTVKMHDVYVIGTVFDNPEYMNAEKYNYQTLKERLAEIDKIEDDQEFCIAEYDAAIQFFIEHNYMLSERDMETVRSRGLMETYDIYKNGYIKDLWLEFGDIPMDPETECIESKWHGFPAGTHREDIWHWFEETFDISVAEDLMYA